MRTLQLTPPNPPQGAGAAASNESLVPQGVVGPAGSESMISSEGCIVLLLGQSIDENLDPWKLLFFHHLVTYALQCSQSHHLLHNLEHRAGVLANI